MAKKLGKEIFFGFSLNPFHLLIVIGISIGSYYLANSNWLVGGNKGTLRYYYPTAIGMTDLDTIYEHIPPFAFTNQTGEILSIPRKDNLPFILVLTSYSEKEDSIEQLKAVQLQKIQERLNNFADIRMASVVLDSVEASGATLAEIAQKIGANNGEWHVVSGDFDRVYLLLNNGLHMGVNKKDLSLRLPDQVVLIDKKGHTRGRYNGSDEASMKQLLADIETLRKEYLPQKK